MQWLRIIFSERTFAEKDQDKDEDKDKDEDQDEDKDKDKTTERPHKCYIFENDTTQGYQIWCTIDPTNPLDPLDPSDHDNFHSDIIL